MKNKINCITVGDIGTNCWLYPLEDAGENSAVGTDGKQPCVVIDPGDEAALIMSRLRELNWIPRYFLLTHGHFDHVMALPDLLEALGPGPLPKIGIHRLDAHYLGKEALAVHRNSFAAVGGRPSYMDVIWKPLPDADLLFEEGDKAGQFRVLHVPGHSQGSLCFYDEKAGILFSGDTLFRRGYGRTDLPGGNEGELWQSLKRLMEFNGDTVVCPGHGAATTIKEEAGIYR